MLSKISSHALTGFVLWFFHMSSSPLLSSSLSIWSLSLPCTYLVVSRRLRCRSWSQWPVSKLMTISWNSWYEPRVRPHQRCVCWSLCRHVSEAVCRRESEGLGHRERRSPGEWEVVIRLSVITLYSNHVWAERNAITLTHYNFLHFKWRIFLFLSCIFFYILFQLVFDLPLVFATYSLKLLLKVSDSMERIPTEIHLFLQAETAARWTHQTPFAETWWLMKQWINEPRQFRQVCVFYNDRITLLQMEAGGFGVLTSYYDQR